MALRKVAAAVAAIMLFFAAPAFAGASPEDAFRDEVLALLQRAHPDWRVKAAAEPETIEVGSARVWLENLRRRVGDSAGPDREREILSFVEKGMTPAAPSEAFAALKPQLRVQIAPAEFLKQAPSAGLLHRDFLDSLVVAYVLDEPDRYSYVMTDKLAAWGVGEETVRAAAIENLDAALAATPIEPKPGGSGGGRFFAISDNSGYGAARILCPRFMARLHVALGASFRLAIPNRDFLVAWTPDFDHRHEFARQVAKDHATRPHPLSASVFVADDTGLRLATEAELGD